MTVRSSAILAFRARPRALWIALALAGALAAPAAGDDTRPSEMPYEISGDFPQLDAGYRRGDHEVVIIKDGALQPQTTVLEEGQLVAWISYARAASTIVFERETAKSMICHSLVNFSIVEDELRSAAQAGSLPLQGGAARPGRLGRARHDPAAGWRDRREARRRRRRRLTAVWATRRELDARWTPAGRTSRHP